MSFATGFARLQGSIGLAALLSATVPMVALAQQQQQQPRQQRPAQQQPAQQAPAQPAQPQAQPQAQQQGPTVVQVKPEPSQADWTKVCGKDPGTNVEICYTTRDFVSDQGQPVLAVAVYESKAPQTPRVVRFLMPLGLLLQPGIRFAVDQGQAMPGRYSICFPNGCFAEVAQVTPDTINQLKRGTTLNISVQNQALREVTFAVPLTGFGRAFDGPPVDPKVLEEQQRTLQEQLQRRSEEMKKRLEEQSNAAGAGAPASPAPGAPPAGTPAPR
jgi:invasion protein IalB